MQSRCGRPIPERLREDLEIDLVQDLIQQMIGCSERKSGTSACVSVMSIVIGCRASRPVNCDHGGVPLPLLISATSSTLLVYRCNDDYRQASPADDAI
jgi:hypothetical protein